MATCTLNDVLNDARGYLHDTEIAGGEVWTNTALLVHFSEPYRTLFGRLMGASKQVQRVVYITLPANTSILIPSVAGIVDMNAPEMVEERLAPSSIAIATTSTTTPISATTAAPHGLGANGTVIQGSISGVLGTSAPWGVWFVTVTGTSTFTLNGSSSDGVGGTGGALYRTSTNQFTEVSSLDLTAAGLDGPPQENLGCYLWLDGAFQFRGATQDVQLRITYYASGTPPTTSGYVINIDNARDFLGAATAANAAQANGWNSISDRLNAKAYGNPSDPTNPGLLDVFMIGQVLALQRGPSRRQQAFRDKRSRFGNYVLG